MVPETTTQVRAACVRGGGGRSVAAGLLLLLLACAEQQAGVARAGPSQRTANEASPPKKSASQGNLTCSPHPVTLWTRKTLLAGPLSVNVQLAPPSTPPVAPTRPPCLPARHLTHRACSAAAAMWGGAWAAAPCPPAPRASAAHAADDRQQQADMHPHNQADWLGVDPVPACFPKLIERRRGRCGGVRMRLSS